MKEKHSKSGGKDRNTEHTEHTERNEFEKRYSWKR